MITQWFDRSKGEWHSHRRYLYGESAELMTSELLVGDLNDAEKAVIPEDLNSDYYVKFGWQTVKYSSGEPASSGEMLVGINSKDGKMYRSQGYMTSNPTMTDVTMIDEDTILFDTEYGKQRFREEIRLLHNDSVRLRQTIGFKGNRVTIVGQYYETRKENETDVPQVSTT